MKKQSIFDIFHSQRSTKIKICLYEQWYSRMSESHDYETSNSWEMRFFFHENRGNHKFLISSDLKRCRKCQNELFKCGSPARSSYKMKRTFSFDVFVAPNMRWCSVVRHCLNLHTQLNMVWPCIIIFCFIQLRNITNSVSHHVERTIAFEPQYEWSEWWFFQDVAATDILFGSITVSNRC